MSLNSTLSAFIHNWPAYLQPIGRLRYATSLDTILTLEMVSILCRLYAFLENRPAKKLILLRLELSGTGERKPILGFSLLLRDRRLDPIVWVWAMKEKCSPVSWKTAYPFHFTQNKDKRTACSRPLCYTLIFLALKNWFFHLFGDNFFFS